MIMPGQRETPKKKKKSPKKRLSMSEQINLENRQNEKNDEELSSESSEESSSSSSSDEDNFLLGNAKSECNVVIKEEEFDKEQKLKFTPDVYNYTICANMTKCCSPLQ